MLRKLLGLLVFVVTFLVVLFISALFWFSLGGFTINRLVGLVLGIVVSAHLASKARKLIINRTGSGQ